MTEPVPLLRAIGIGKRFGPVVALHDADFTVRSGEVVALAGENGSGKSTLARTIAGVLTRDSGRIELAGQSVRFGNPRQALAAGICLVSQEPTLVPGLTIAENVLLTRLIHPARLVHRAALADQADALLRRVGLRVDPRRPAGSLAAGDRELVEVAKALAADPKVLILDEVTARLPDPERLFAAVEPLCRAGAGIVLITHRLREIRRLAGRAVVLRDGTTVAELIGHELSDERIAAAMVGRDLSEYFRKQPTPRGDVRLETRELVTDRSSHRISLSVRSGEIVGVAGLVGAGRTELLETLAGARRARGGTVLVDGVPVALNTPAAARRVGVTLVPEDRTTQGLAPAHSVRDNVATPWLRALRRTDRAADQSRAIGAVRDFRIRTPGVHTPVAALSGGNAQKVVLARALGSDPRVLLLDEPTRGVDIGARSDIYHLIGQRAARGAAVLLASSDLLELLGLADRIMVLAEGRPAGELERAEATEERIALLAMGGAHHGGGGEHDAV